MEISKKLKSLREKHNLTQEELAFKLKLSRSTISNYESGLRTPDINVLYDICNFYNITLDSLFSETIEYKKIKNYKYNKIISSIIISLIIAILLIILIPNLFNSKHNYGYDINNDELKVQNCDEISIVKFVELANRKTYKVEIINILKGNSFNYVSIQNNKIDCNINNYYLIFGNRLQFNKNNKNYASLDCLEIFDYQFIYELENYNLDLEIFNQTDETKALIDYYTYYINKEEKENIKEYKVANTRHEKLQINNKDPFKNSYDYIDLNLYEDLYLLNKLKYKYIDVEVTMKIEISKYINPKIYLYNNIGNDKKYKIAEYEINNNDLKDITFSFIKIHFTNIYIASFLNDNPELIIRYGYDSLFNSSWTNYEVDIKLGYRK